MSQTIKQISFRDINERRAKFEKLSKLLAKRPGLEPDRGQILDELLDEAIRRLTKDQS